MQRLLTAAEITAIRRGLGPGGWPSTSWHEHQLLATLDAALSALRDVHGRYDLVCPGCGDHTIVSVPSHQVQHAAILALARETT